ncbi:MAG: chemotaxis protein CheW [Porticoccaceae bacterium]|jgi:chemosensory pili system protein ChpC|nr:chemotaxis protein CheW [Porticoccaceae bacterium]
MNQTALKTESLPDRIPCLLAPLSDRKLLLPITAVAEVINTITMPEAGQDGTALYGWMTWRDQRIPLISFEAALGGAKPQLKLENRMAIINAIGDASGLGFYAILLQGLPTPIQVNGDSLRESDEAKQKLVLMTVQLGEEKATVADFSAVEAVVAAFSKK